MADDTIYTNMITLECLMNPELYRKLVKKGNLTEDTDETEEMEFYRKRISLLTKEMLMGKKTSTLDAIFKHYISECIKHFKFIDKMDTYQEEYMFMVDDKQDEIIEDISYNDILVKNAQRDGTIKKFIKIKNTKKEYLPQAKDINLRDPKYKTKGIKEKQNLTDIYDENKKMEKEKPKISQSGKGKKENPKNKKICKGEL
jgi:hypothetical protein